MITQGELAELIAFGQKTLDRSGKLIRNYLDSGFSHELKSDNSVVTDADRATEELIRGAVEKAYPGHDIVGEEYGGASQGGKSDYQWIIDPIDGTANFLTGIPTFGTILACYYRGEPVVGFSDHPMLNIRYYAGKGRGMFKGDRRLRVRGLSGDSLSAQENIALSSRGFFERAGEGERFDNFLRIHPNVRIYRDVFAHGLVAEGAIGAMIEMSNMIWDLAATKLYMQEAGGLYLERKSGGSGNEMGLKLDALFGAPKSVEHLARLFGF